MAFTSTEQAKANLRAALGDVMRGFAPPPALTVTEWAEQYRSLSAESAAEPGKYRVDRTPYAAGIMEAFGDPRVKQVVWMSSAQVGKSTAIENVIGYHIHLNPLPIMAVQPTLELAETYSKDRISPMIRDCAVLGELVHEANARASGNTIKQKKFPGGHLTITGANSPTSLRSRPIGLLLGDELDAWKDTPEGDPCVLVEARTKRFPNAKIGYFSTPTVEGQSRIASKYEESDQRKVYVPCPHCGESFVMTFEALKWREGEPVKASNGTTRRRADEAWFECPHCSGRLNDVARARAIAEGEWRPHATFRGIAGFWCWEANNPSSRALDMANAWLGAQGDIQRLQAIKNTVFGEPWKEASKSMDWRRLYDRAQIEPFSLGEVPAGVKVLFGGVDVQHDRLELYVWGYGDNLESWLIDFQVIQGDPNDPQTWQRLTNFVNAIQYPSVDRMQMFPVVKWAIDQGYLGPRVNLWASQFPPDRVVVVKGEEGGYNAGRRGSEVEVSINGIKSRTAHAVWLVSKGYLLTQLHSWLALDPPTKEQAEAGVGYPTGYIHVPAMQEEFFRQITADALVGGKWRDKFTYFRNEASDIRCYCDFVAAQFWIPKRHAAQRTLPVAAHYVEPDASRPAAQAQSPMMNRPQGRPRGFKRFGGW